MMPYIAREKKMIVEYQAEFCKRCRASVSEYICWYPGRGMHEHLCWTCFNNEHPDELADKIESMFE